MIILLFYCSKYRLLFVQLTFQSFDSFYYYSLYFLTVRNFLCASAIFCIFHLKPIHKLSANSLLYLFYFAKQIKQFWDHFFIFKVVLYIRFTKWAIISNWWYEKVRKKNEKTRVIAYSKVQVNMWTTLKSDLISMIYK